MMLTPSDFDFSATKEARLRTVRNRVAHWFAEHFSNPLPFSAGDVSVTSRGDYDEIMVFLPNNFVEQAETQARELEQELLASGSPAYIYVRGFANGNSNGQNP